MNVPARFHRVVFPVVLLLAGALVWSGCNLLHLPPAQPGDREPPNPQVQDPGLPGLPSDDPDATRAYLATLRFVPAAKVSTITCDSGGVTVPILIQPETRSHNLDPRHAAVRGRIVARVVNGGTGRCSTLKLSPGDTAYWWMGPHGQYPLTTVFWRIPARGRVGALAKTGPTLVFGEPQRSEPDARISPVLVHPIPGEGGDGGWSRFTHNSTWIACLGACCESNNLVSTE